MFTIFLSFLSSTFPKNHAFIITFSLLINLLLPVTNSIYFKFPRFAANSNINFQGDAVNTVGTIEFNKVNYVNRVGIITYSDKVHLCDKNSGTMSDFSTHFTFFIDTQNRAPQYCGHGITFFIAPAGFEIPPNSAGGFIGLLNTTTFDTTSNHLMFVEFDSFVNPEWDPTYEHVGININSIGSVANTPWNASLHSGDTADVWIVYDYVTKNLTVSWSYKTEPKFNQRSSLSMQIDLMTIIPEWVSIGFSAATGNNVERHVLQSWDFSSNLEKKLSSETVDQEPTESNDKSKTKCEVALFVSVGLGILLIVGIVLFFVYRRRRKMKILLRSDQTALYNQQLERGAGPRRFSYAELDTATYSFSRIRKLGEGGFGAVYKGYLIELDMAIAVKKTSGGSSSQNVEKQYITEVTIISRLRHKNLVQLVGWCHENDQFLLVYEFMPNGSLDAHLFGNKPPLPWSMRYKIVLGLAAGLIYLHEECEQCVLHRDIKPSNIMLDASFKVKLGDFGLARLMNHEINAQTTSLAGTLGYMSPEYISTGKANKESDVYSFGVVVLEIATGKKSRQMINFGPQNGLVEWIWDLYGRNELTSAADEKLGIDYDPKQIECLMIVGLWCAHPDYKMRPSMKQVIQVLNFEVTLPSLPSKMPVPIYDVPTSSASVSSGVNSLTATSLYIGR